LRTNSRAAYTHRTAPSCALTAAQHRSDLIVDNSGRRHARFTNINVVGPGTTDTGMLTRFTNTDEKKAALVSTVPVKRLATPEEIAYVITFVASAMRRT